ncbi:MAG: hypothetical protein Q8K63_11415 [Acidimicrobiales bacterium]|nr:hypothetical protein [Acidimicrobiales bacterium]
MPATDSLKQYLDAGLEFTELTRKRAEKIVKDLVKAGEVQREHTQQRVDELVERSRQASAAFAEAVRTEVTRQLTELGLIDAPQKAASTAKAAAKKSSGTAKAAAKKTSGTAKAAAKKTTGAATKTAKKAASTAKKATGS